ncbi:hypothetical protein [Kutzneria sp. CA-103260]|uniref:hypothetical protein n=1 Tax=Kutzneria sp. CA-103260 TaxID=2802641 RepID=UPI001BA6B491|nr:hypothetical protein [Kutzneria sp. CA-103260]QUQ64576.1 hypothetical protein JJ691_22960 [Kutzneria sp. CA-103260]
MAIDTINRTNIQALWRYMPGQPFNFAARAAVLGDTPRQVSALDVPEGWVAAPLRRLIRPFAEAASGVSNIGPELDIIDRGQYELVRAEDLRAVRFPNTYLCGKCNRFRSVRPGDRPPDCHEHGPMEQFQWAEVHECGHIGEVNPPHCRNNCRAGMRLFNTKSLSLSRWYWRCVGCGTRSDVPVARACSGCRRGRVTVTRVPQTWVYYPQQITVLNPPTRNTYASLAHEQMHAAAVAQALGMLPPGLDGLRAAGGADADPIAKVQALAASFGWEPGNPLYEQVLAEARSKADSAPAWRDEVDALGLDEEHLDALGEECRQLSLARAATGLTVDDLTAAGGPLATSYAAYRQLFDRYGLSDVTLLRQLPVAYVAAGYTRLSSRASAVNRSGASITPRFRFFPTGRTGKFRMYGVRTETEGLLFQIDPLKIVEWLVRSSVVDDPAVTDAADAQRWLFRVTEPVVDVFNPPANRISEAVLGLTHSFAHRAMKALAARCGLNVDSLAEFLFPSNGAFLIYANTRSEFILGGLEHVFRFDLPDALRELDAESRCVFDPPCRHHFGGACAACLHVSEVACARFNTVLNRNLLFGSLPQAADSDVSGDIQWHGYWTS